MTKPFPAEKTTAELFLPPAPDRQRWGNPSNYNPAWAGRAKLAAALVPDNASVLEIGVGTGVFRDLVKGRTNYIGADLQPLDTDSIALDLDQDPLPSQCFDWAVLLGVFGYLNQPEAAAKKLCGAATHIIVSYCCRRAELTPEAVRDDRAQRGWVNSFDKTQFIQIFSLHGHVLASCKMLKAEAEFEEFLMEFRRSDLGTDSASENDAALERRTL